jgi:hypothetical protein
MPIAPQVGICHHHEYIRFFITLLHKTAPLFFWNTP